LKGYEKQTNNKRLRKLFHNCVTEVVFLPCSIKVQLPNCSNSEKVQNKAKRQSVKKGVSVGRMPKDECAYLKDHTFSCKVFYSEAIS